MYTVNIMMYKTRSDWQWVDVQDGILGLITRAASGLLTLGADADAGPLIAYI